MDKRKKLLNISLEFDLEKDNAVVEVKLEKIFDEMIKHFDCEKEVYQRLETVSTDLDRMIIMINDKGNK